MSPLKDALSLSAIFFAYGITGHMDCEDAVMLEEAQQHQPPSTSRACWPAITSPTGLPAAQTRNPGSDHQHDDPSDPASDHPPAAIALCAPVIY